MAIDPGTQMAAFLPEGWSYRSVIHYRVRLGVSVHEYVLTFVQLSTCVSSIDRSSASTTMAIDPGTQMAAVLPRGRRYRSVFHYRVRLGVSVHEYVLTFVKLSTCVSSIDRSSASTTMAIDPGTQTAAVLPREWRYRSVTHYRVRLGISVHKCILTFVKLSSSVTLSTEVQRRRPFTRYG